MVAKTQSSASAARHRWLLAVDGSAQSAEAARYVARWAGPLAAGEVHVVTAEPIGSFRAYALHRDEVMADAVERATHAARDALKILDEANVGHRFEAKVGDPGEVIMNAAHGHGADEIVLGTRGLGELSGVMLGSVAYKVVHLADLPVTLVHPPHAAATSASPPPDTHRVLLAHDGSESAARALDYLVRQAGSRIAIEVHVARVETTTVPDAGAMAAASAPDGAATGQGDAASAALAAAVDELAGAGIQASAHAAKGPVAQTLVRLAREHGCARIVMGKRGLGVVQSLMIGSTAYAVVHASPLPVTLVK